MADSSKVNLAEVVIDLRNKLEQTEREKKKLIYIAGVSQARVEFLENLIDSKEHVKSAKRLIELEKRLEDEHRRANEEIEKERGRSSDLEKELEKKRNEWTDERKKERERLAEVKKELEDERNRGDEDRRRALAERSIDNERASNRMKQISKDLNSAEERIEELTRMMTEDKGAEVQQLQLQQQSQQLQQQSQQLQQQSQQLQQQSQQLQQVQQSAAERQTRIEELTNEVKDLNEKMVQMAEDHETNEDLINKNLLQSQLLIAEQYKQNNQLTAKLEVLEKELQQLQQQQSVRDTVEGFGQAEVYGSMVADRLEGGGESRIHPSDKAKDSSETAQMNQRGKKSMKRSVKEDESMENGGGNAVSSVKKMRANSKVDRFAARVEKNMENVNEEGETTSYECARERI